MAQVKKLAIDPKQGQELTIPAGRYHQEQKVRVIRVARVKFDTVPSEHFDTWVETGRTVGLRTWRKDTAQEDGAYSYNAPTIYTPEGLAERDRSAAADKYLQSAGVSPWDVRSRGVIDPLTLANLIRIHLGEEEI